MARWSAVGSGGFGGSGRSVGSGGEVCGKAKKRKAARGSGTTREDSQDREARVAARPKSARLREGRGRGRLRRIGRCGLRRAREQQAWEVFGEGWRDLERWSRLRRPRMPRCWVLRTVGRPLRVISAFRADQGIATKSP